MSTASHHRRIEAARPIPAFGCARVVPALAALAIAALLVLAGTALADENHWTLLRPGGQAPEALRYAAFTTDPGRNRLLVFGGRDIATQRNDLWVLDMTAETWALVRPRGTLPTYRSVSAMAFDPVGDRAVVFGGTWYDSEHSRYVYYDETWFVEFGGQSGPEWVKLPFTAHKPDPRGGASMVYQPVAGGAGRMVLFGGYDDYQGFNDVWSLDLAPGRLAWTEIGTDCGTRPTPRDRHAAVYDPMGNRMLVLDGWQRARNTDSTIDELWAFDLSARGGCWTEIDAPGARPQSLGDTTVVLDSCPSTPRLIVFGGVSGWETDTSGRVNDTNDTWTLSLDTPGGETWVKLDPLGARPRPRDAHAAAYDAVGRRMIAFGGWENEGEHMRDTWALELAPCAAATLTPTHTQTPSSTLEPTPTGQDTPTSVVEDTPTPQTASPTPDEVGTAIAATLTALAPTVTASRTADVVATSVAGTLTASAPTSTSTPTATATPDALGTSIAGTLTALARPESSLYLPIARRGLSSP